MRGERPRFHRALGWGLVAALALRTALAARAPIIETDGAYWAGLAAALARGDLHHGLSSAWPPLFPALIAAAFYGAHRVGLVPGPAVLEACARAVSVLAGALLLVPLHAIARRLLSPRAATIAVVLAAVHPRLLEYSAAALSEATYTLLLISALALLVAREQDDIAPLRREMSCGALFGLAYLARPEGLPLAGALWIAGVVRRPARGPGAVAESSAARATAAAASPAYLRRASLAAGLRGRPALVLATLIVALPWLIFLHATLGRWSLGEKGEYNFWRAFRTEYSQGFGAPPGLAARVNESPELAPTPSGSGVRILEFARRHPGTVLARCVGNLVTILVSTLPVTLYWPLVPFAIAGLLPPRPRGAWPLLVTLGVMVLLYAPFSVDRRFFVPAVPLLLIPCALGIERAESWLARRSSGARARRTAEVALALLVVLAIAYAFGPGSGFEHAPEARRAGEWLRRAESPAAQGSAVRPVAPRPIVMARKPWVAFYAGGLIATLPDLPPDSLVALARARHADVLVADGRSAAADRPRLAALVDGAARPAGLVAIHREIGPPPLVLYSPLR